MADRLLGVQGNLITGTPISLTFAANAIDFTSGSAYLTNVVSHGAADSGQGIFSAWLEVDGAGTQFIYTHADSSGGSIAINWQSEFLVWGPADNMAAPGNAVWWQAQVAPAQVGWYHWLVGWDFSVPTFQVYLDDVSIAGTFVQSPVLNATLNMTPDNSRVGVGAGSSNQWQGCISELYLHDQDYLDFSVTANRRKFRDASGKPVNLGSDGSTPTGTPPLVYLNNPAATFEVNKGTGVNFNHVGTLLVCDTGPSD